MKIHNTEKLKQELTSMFHHKWQCLNHLLIPLVIQDVISFIEKYNNQKEENKE